MQFVVESTSNGFCALYSVIRVALSGRNLLPLFPLVLLSDGLMLLTEFVCEVGEQERRIRHADFGIVEASLEPAWQAQLSRWIIRVVSLSQVDQEARVAGSVERREGREGKR